MLSGTKQQKTGDFTTEKMEKACKLARVGGLIPKISGTSISICVK